jgi:enoyl-CoA hydratase/3-hydroxyacyl-CoA dehydrogenase
VAIIGGGLMGSGIATALILSDILVVLKEVNGKFLEAGINRVKGVFLVTMETYIEFIFELYHIFVRFGSANLQNFVKKGRMTKEDHEKKLSLLSGVLDYEQFRDADVVIEVDTVLYCFYGFVQ